MMSVCWISFSLSVLMIAFLSSAAGQGAVQDEYIGNITGVDFSGALSRSLELYSESDLYRVAGSVCRVLAASRRSERLLNEQSHLLNLSQEQLNSLELMVVVGVKVQEASCAWFNAMFGGVAADESGECSVPNVTSFCLRVQIVNTYLDLYTS